MVVQPLLLALSEASEILKPTRSPLDSLYSCLDAFLEQVCFPSYSLEY